MLKLFGYAVLWFVLIFGWLFGGAFLIDTVHPSPAVRPWLASFLFFAPPTWGVWRLVRRWMTKRRVMNEINARIESATAPLDFMTAWAAMGAVMLHGGSALRPLPPTLKSLEGIEGFFADVDVAAEFPNPEVATKIMLAYGAFAGEIIRAQHGGIWRQDGPLRFSLVLPNGAVADLQGAVAKALLKQDPGFSVLAYVRAMPLPAPMPAAAAAMPAQPAAPPAMPAQLNPPPWQLAFAERAAAPLRAERAGLAATDARCIALDAQIAATVFAYVSTPATGDPRPDEPEPLLFTADAVRLIEKAFRIRPEATQALKTEAYSHYLGAFLGECLRRELGGSWVYDAATDWWLLQINDRLTCNPIAKVQKFFAAGPDAGESLDAFYRSSIALARQ